MAFGFNTAQWICHPVARPTCVTVNDCQGLAGGGICTGVDVDLEVMLLLLNKYHRKMLKRKLSTD